MLLAAIRKRFSSRNCRLRKSFSTVILLTNNLCCLSICFLHDRQQNGNVKRSEFVKFEGRKTNKCSRYRGICRPFQRLFYKECKFLPDHEYSSPGEKNANVNLCLFCRLRQHYKVHTYVISMEFSAVNCRRPSRETPLGLGAKKDGCFRRLNCKTNCSKRLMLKTTDLRKIASLPQKRVK